MTKPKFRPASISFQLSFLLLVAILILVIFFAFVGKVVVREQRVLFQSRVTSRQTIFNGYVNSNSKELITFADDYTQRDDMVNFAKGGGKDLAFARENIDSSLLTYDSDAVWVYSPQGKLIYSVGQINETGAKFDASQYQPVTAVQLSSIFKKNGVYHFYANTPQGVYDIAAASINPTIDTARSTPAQGYYLAGRLLDQDYLNAINKTVEGNAKIVLGAGQNDANSVYDTKTDHIAFGKVLNDYTGHSLGVLKIDYVADDLRQVTRDQNTLSVLGASVVIVLGIVLLGYLYRRVLSPMKNVELALTHGKIQPVTHLLGRSDEFGSISRLMSQAFAQQKLVLAQKYGVERQILARTSQLRSEQKTLSALFDSLPVGVALIRTSDGKIVRINRVAEKIIGFHPPGSADQSDVRGSYTVVQEDGTPLAPEEMPSAVAIKTGHTVMRDDLFIRHHDSTMISIRTVVTPILVEGGKPSLAVGVFEDRSHEHELERSREEFFSIASHELRTPLTAIRGNTAMIQDYYKDALKDRQLNEMISDIHESSIRLIDIVNDFLDTSRLEQQRVKFNLEPVDLVATANSVTREFAVTTSRRKIQLLVATPDKSLPKVWADQDRVKQVMINLIGNSLKFTAEGSITVHFEKRGQMIKTLVTDTGQGMPPEAQSKLFRKFEQTGSSVLTRDSVRGTGLGLYISKMIVEQMGGQIAMESSRVGTGTTFSFSLPIKSSIPPPPIPPTD